MKRTTLEFGYNLYTQILILAEATMRFVLKVFSVLRRWRARYSVPSGCLGRTVVQNLTPDVAFLLINASLLGRAKIILVKMLIMGDFAVSDFERIQLPLFIQCWAKILKLP